MTDKKDKPTSREKAVRVKTGRFRKSSSTKWLQRQLNDPYVHEAQRLGYRSRAAFKLLEIDEKVKILKPDRLSWIWGRLPAAGPK